MKIEYCYIQQDVWNRRAGLQIRWDRFYDFVTPCHKVQNEQLYVEKQEREQSMQQIGSREPIAKTLFLDNDTSG